MLPPNLSSLNCACSRPELLPNLSSVQGFTSSDQRPSAHLVCFTQFVTRCNSVGFVVFAFLSQSFAKGHQSAVLRRVVDDQTTSGRAEEEEGNVMSGITTDERAVNTTSYLAAVMIGGRRRAAHRGGGSETPRDHISRRCEQEKLKSRKSKKRKRGTVYHPKVV